MDIASWTDGVRPTSISVTVMVSLVESMSWRSRRSSFSFESHVPSNTMFVELGLSFDAMFVESEKCLWSIEVYNREGGVR